jgi:Flavin containing amine oxidoreductase.
MKVICVESRIHRAPGDKGRVVVTVEDGRSFPFDDVVVTAPLGWLKCHQDVFRPPLEARLTRAIGGIGYGNLEKVRHFDA